MDRPHARQFVFGPEPCKAWADWVVTRVGRLWLSCCPSLCVHQAVNANGEDVILIGLPIECTDKLPPQQQLPLMTVEDMARMTDTWSNRWALIIGSRIATDAGGLLGVYYPSEMHERFYASSSQRLLGRIFPGCGQDVREAAAYAPATRQQGIFALLPGQWLDVETGSVEQPREPLFAQLQGSVEDLQEEYAALLRNCLKGIHHRERKTLAISLSGGSDSRRNIAAACAAGVPFRAFTFRKPYWNTSDADLHLPAQVGRLLGFPVHSIDPRDYPPMLERGEAYAEHTAFRKLNRPGELFYYYVRNMWKGYESAQIDGQGYELTSHYYHKEIGPFECADAMLAWCFSSTPQSRAASKRYLAAAVGGSMVDLRDFVTLLADHPFCGQMNQAMDMWAVFYTPANCRRMYSLSQSVTVEQRKDKRFLMSVTDLLEPRLAGLPTNPPDSLAKRLVKVARTQGLAGMSRIALNKLEFRTSLIGRAIRPEVGSE